jgi:hypothetical protein
MILWGNKEALFMTYDWDNLNHLQIGKYAEYLTKMELTASGCDVYTSEVDDRGIDFVVRKDSDHYFDIQVKSLRLSKSNYVFMVKDKFVLKDNLLLSLVLFQTNEKPSIYLIPSMEWANPNALLVSRDYDKPNQKSKPEWGLNLSKINLPLLEPYEFNKTVKLLIE